MDWKEFLKHPKVGFDTKRGIKQNPGEYLYKKMLHDMLECLNGYKGYVEIASSLEDIPDNIQDWLLRWSPQVEAWLSSLTTLSNDYYQENTKYHNVDPYDLIMHLPDVVPEVALQYEEAKTLNISAKVPSGDLLKKAVSSLARLNLICNNIRGQKYLHLWNSEY